MRLAIATGGSIAIAAVAWLGCDPPAGTSATPPSASSPVAAAGSAPASPAPTPYVPSSAVPPISVAGEAGDCPALPPVAPGASDDATRAAALAAALRRAACEPELYTRSIAELKKELALPSGLDASFGDPDGIRFTGSPMPSAKALVAALGIDRPVVRLRWDAYHDSWWLGSDATTGKLTRFGPGTINLQVPHDAAEGDPEGKVIPWTAEMEPIRFVAVAMPDGVITVEPDAEGLKQMVAAMEVLAADPGLLAREPEEVAKKLGLEGERFRVARTSLHSGDQKIDGISFQPQRTRIMADAFAAALGLKDAEAENVNREHDEWEMSVDGTTEVSWRGIELGVSVSPKDRDARTTTLVGAEVTFVTMRPKS